MSLFAYCFEAVCLSGENVKEFFFRVAALAFEDAILRDLEGAVTQSIGQGDILSKTISSTCLLAT